MKKSPIQILLVLAVFCILIASALYLVISFDAPRQPVNNNSTGVFPIDRPSSTRPVGTSSSVTTTRLRITDTQFAKMKERWEVLDFDGNVVGTSTSDYAISYTRNPDLIQVAITSDPAEEVQKFVEAELVKTLGMTEQDICRLNTEVLWRTWSTNYEFQTRSLTFCAGTSE